MKAVPKLRFKEFKESWDKTKLADITTKISDGLHSTPNYNENGEYYFVNGNNLIDNKIYFAENTKRVSKEEYLKHRKKLSDRTILISINGTIGSLALYNGEKIILGKSACYINVNNNTDKYFVYNSLQTPKTKNFFTSELTGSTIKNLSLTTIKNCEFGFPSLPEQQKIASFLSAIDEKIQQLTRKKELLEQYKKGVMQQLFSGKLRFKPDYAKATSGSDENGKAYPKWEEKRLGDVSEFLKGKGISKLDIDDGGNTECIRYGQLYTDYSETISKVISRTSVDTKELVLSEANDVIIPASGETQIDIATASCVLRSGIALGGDLNIIRTKLSGVFLSYYLNTQKKFDIARLSQGITVVHLYPSQLSLLKLSIPCLEEQQKIASYLSSIDTKIESVALQITQSQTFKKGLLQQMFV